MLSLLPLNGEMRLMRVIDFIMEEHFRTDTRQFFLALWGLSGHNKFVEQLLNQAYLLHRRARPACAQRTANSVGKPLL